MNSTSPHLFCLGLGYTAITLAKDLLGQGWRVSGTCRTSEKFPELTSLGITPYIFDSGLPLENIWDMDSVTHILISIPPDTGGDIVIQSHLSELQSLKNLRWLGYLSTTGVYGNHDGGWVTEETPVNPDNDRSKRRVAAEQQWLDTNLPVHIFRLSGIYGAGRSVIESLKAGKARRIDKPEQLFSRIHVADISQILRKSIAKPNIGSIYNCADDLPASQADIVTYGAELLGMEPPPLIPFTKAALSPVASSFYSGSRRVSNNKIKQELGVKLKYPDYKAGLVSFRVGVGS